MDKSYRLYCFLLIMFINTSFVIGQIKDTSKQECVVKEQLSRPFGTLLNLTVEIMDGEELNDKSHQSSFLFKVTEVENLKLNIPIIIEFKDETGKFPDTDFGLYKLHTEKKAGVLSQDEIKKINKEYVGKKFKVVGYETGEFKGVPDGYFKYQEVRQDYSFHFFNYLVVIADITNK